MHKIIATIAVCAASLGLNPAMAGQETGRDAVRIEADQNAKAFVFIIDDEPVALLDKNGLSVAEHISYGGSLTDKGRDGARRDIETTLGGKADDAGQ